MLDTLPPEVLSHITYHLVLESCAPPTALLATCNAVYGAVGPETNPNLYAQVFRATYDTAAAARRLELGSGKWNAEEDEDDLLGESTPLSLTPYSPSPMSVSGANTPASVARPPRPRALRPRQLTAELRNRTRALTRLRSGDIRAEDLWVVYLMLIENGASSFVSTSPPSVHWGVVCCLPTSQQGFCLLFLRPGRA